MFVFEAENSTEMAYKVYPALREWGEVSTSRNGPVLRFPGAATFIYTNPINRANFTPDRDANPFFHIVEGCWMLAGRRDVELLSLFNSNIHKYSDEGVVFNAAYGHRVRKFFWQDQLQNVVDVLKASPDSRQAVVQIWDKGDLTGSSLDKACNISMVFEIQNGKVGVLINNRSNDLIWGNVTGANPVHFSFFLQWVADQLKLPVGRMVFVSANAHVYTDNPLWDKVKDTERPKRLPSATYLPMEGIVEFEDICIDIIECADGETLLDEDDYASLFIRNVVVPVINTWLARKQHKDYMEQLDKCYCPALGLQCAKWLELRDGY